MYWGLMSIEKVKEECDLPRNLDIKAIPLYRTWQFSFISEGYVAKEKLEWQTEVP